MKLQMFLTWVTFDASDWLVEHSLGFWFLFLSQMERWKWAKFLSEITDISDMSGQQHIPQYQLYT